MAGGLELYDLYGSFQPKSLYSSMNLSNIRTFFFSWEMFTEIGTTETYINENSWLVFIFIPFLFPFCLFPNIFFFILKKKFILLFLFSTAVTTCFKNC